jgi:uncharacterized protein YjdB
MLNRIGRNLGATVLAAMAGAVSLVSCQRDFDSPYVPGNPGYAGDDWTRDEDGNGIADSVDKYAPGCALPPRQCMANAKVIGRISGERNSLSARDMILWLDDSAKAPALAWTPSEGSVRGYVLSSSDSAKVRPRDGRLQPAAVGSAQITVTVPGADSLFASFIAKVVSGGKKVESVSAKDIMVQVGRDTSPELAWVPADPLFMDYSMASENPEVARIVDRKIRGVFPGKTTITLETMDGGRKAAFNATVQNGPSVVYAASVTAEDMYLVKGGGPLSPTLFWAPEKVTDKNFKLTSLDTNVVVIQDRNKVVPKGVGSTQVYVIVLDGSGVTADFNVSVSAQAVAVKGISGRELSLVAGGDAVSPKLSWQPSDATNRKYSLTSADSGVAKARNGMILPVSMGTSDFVVTTDDGGFMDTFTVTVNRPDTTLHVDSVQVANLSVPIGTDRKPTIAWFPADAGNQAYTLASMDTAVATVANGLVHPVKAGIADFRLTSEDGARTADFKVTVYAPEILTQNINADSMFLVLDGEHDVQAPNLSWIPANATNRGYALVSMDPDIALIEDGASVRAKAVGVGRIQISSVDGPVSFFTVVVSAKVVKLISMTCPAFTMNLGDAPVAPAVTFNPQTATDKSVIFKAPAGSGIVSVDAQNRIAALAPGNATVTAVSGENPGITAPCPVTVVALVKSVTAKDDILRLGSPEKDLTPLLTFVPANASDKRFSLQAKDTTIVKTNGMGYKAMKGGATTVIVRTLDGSDKADTFSVVVQIPLTSISAKDYTMKTTDTALYAPWPLFSFTPKNVTDSNWYLTYTYPTAAPAPSTILKIEGGWQLRALGPGAVSLTVTSLDNANAKDTFTVTVIRPVSGLSAEPVTMKVGDADKPAAVTIAPPDASDKGYTLSGGNTAVATVVANKIHAVSGGTAAFTATSTYDATKSVTFQVTVSVPVISLSAPDISMKVGDPLRDPVITWNPAGATNKGYSMVSTNTSAVLISSNKLQAVGPGNANVILASSDGGKLDTFAVSVTQPVVSISVADMAFKRYEGDKDPVITWNPGSASNKAYTLSGGNAAVATVVSNRIHPVAAGTANFTVTSTDGGKQASFQVTIQVPLEAISADDMNMSRFNQDEAPTVHFTPADAPNKGYTLHSTDTQVAAIVNGKVSPQGRGTATIVITSTENPNVSNSFQVRVNF